MRLYHRSEAVEQIWRHGFSGATAVLFSDRPFDLREDASLASFASLVFEVPEQVVAAFEDRRLRQAPSPSRRFLVPPPVANTFFPIVDRVPPASQA